MKSIYENYSKAEAKAINSLVLAYLGDTVYEKYIRLYLVKKYAGFSAHKLHVKAINYVKAEGQSKFILNFQDELEEEEILIFKRGRNAKSNTSPKNADITDYRNATGLESLIGYLSLIGNNERIKTIMESLFTFYEREGNNES